MERSKIADAPLSVVLLSPSLTSDGESVTQHWRTWLDQRPGETELLVVHVGQETATVQANSTDRLRTIFHLAPAGPGPALQTGIWLARYPLTLIAPADGQFQPADLQRLFEAIDLVDLVVGCRVDRPPPWWLRVVNLLKRLLQRILLGFAGEPRLNWLGWRGWGRRWVARHIFGVKLSDPESPVGLFRSEVLQRIPIQSHGGFVHLEIVAKANHLGCLMSEAPVPWRRPERDEPDPTWRQDCSRVRREPEFGPPSLPLAAGVSGADVLASGHGTAS